MIAELGALVSLGSKIAEISTNTINQNANPAYRVSPAEASSVYDALNKAKSIAEKAKTGIMQYPAIFSSTMYELDMVVRIAKHLEVQYALFSMITAGLNPNTMTSVGNYIRANFGTESFFGEKHSDFAIEAGDIEISTIEPPTKEQIAHYKELDRANMAAYDKERPIEDMALEADVPLNEEGRIGLATPSQIINVNGRDRINSTDSGSTSASMNAAIKLKSAPTIVNLKLNLGQINGQSHTVDFPLAVRVNPHIVADSEMKTIFEYAIEDKNLIHRFIKLTSGEIKFFRDFIFQIDRAQRDSDVYKKMGRHPWYRQIMEKKTLSKVRRGAQLMDKGVADVLPTVTLVCTKEEITAATKMRYSYLLKNQKYLNQIVEKMFLLCLVIYDSDLGTLYFNYAGYKEPMTYHVKELGGEDSSVEKDLAKAMAELVKRMG